MATRDRMADQFGGRAEEPAAEEASGRTRVVAVARRWIGTPYVHQASVRGAGTDCLGLVRGVWRDLVGAEPCRVPPYTPDWGEPAGREVLLEEAARWLGPVPGGPVRAGEVLVFRLRAGRVAKHLGIATGGALSASGTAPDGGATHFVHAYTGHGVIESPLGLPWRRRIAARFLFPASPDR